MIICAVMCGVGLILGCIGYATNGVKNFDRLTEKYSWLHGSDGEFEYVYLKDGEAFDSIVTKGDMDVVIRTGDPQKTRIGCGKNLGTPTLQVKNGVLTATMPETKGGMYLDFHESQYPTLEVYCPAGTTLNTVHVDLDCGDISIGDLSMGRMEIETDTGDVRLEHVTWQHGSIDVDSGDVSCVDVQSGSLQLSSDVGDCSLQGAFKGVNDIELDSGDLELQTTLSESDYSIDAATEAGDLCIGENLLSDYEAHFKSGTGKHRLNIEGDTADIMVKFSGKAAKTHHEEPNHGDHHE